MLGSSTVSELSERELIARVRRQLPPAPSWMVVGIGDDAAVVEPARNRLDVLTVDALVEGVHFDRRFTPAEAIGHRALAVNLSDLAAMGAEPRLALLSMALPPSLTCDDFDAIVGGLAKLAGQHGVHVAGGNLTRTTGPLVIDVTAGGTVKRRGVLTRGGAKPGDHVYVTGTIGSARAGLQFLQQHTPFDTAPPAFVERYLRPMPRVRAGLLLGRSRAASSCMDLSDGLGDALHQVTESSGVGAAIDPDALPIDGDVRTWFQSHGGDPVLDAVAGGDDYELLFTASPKLKGRLRGVARHAGVPLTRIGTCTRELELVLRKNIEGRDVDTVVPRGFSHFR